MTGRIDFVGIGAPRSGTSWLYENLRQHPGVFLPPVKELQHFAGRRSLAVKQKGYERRLRDCTRPLDLAFLERWKDYDRSDERYLALFDLEAGLVKGEISPIYCILGEAGVARFRRVVGTDAKIIFLMRDPIDRDWSHVKLFLHKRAGQPSALPLSEYKSFLLQERVRKRSDYVRTLRLWGRDMFVGFYDDIVNEPAAFLESVCRFLGVDYKASWFRETIGERVNTTQGQVLPELAMPADLQPFLAEINLPMLEELARMMPGGHPDRWLARARGL